MNVGYKMILAGKIFLPAQNRLKRKFVMFPE
jgi:hypothetical protein